MLYASALIGLGDLAGYKAQREVLVQVMQPKMAPALKALLDKFDSSARDAQKHRMWMRVTPAKMLPLGTYHLMGKPETGVMATVRMQNHDSRERTFRLETEVQGATERAVKTFKLGRGKALEMTATPPLSLSFDVGKIRATRPAQLAVRLVETTGGKEQPLLDETFAVDVLPRDYLPLRRTIGGDYPIWTLEYVAAWITPNIKPVEELLSKAKERVAKRRFVGEQSRTLEQVKALYEELQARGVSYVMDPNIDVESTLTQRTRLPGEVLSSTNAQCLEGTLLFATLLESIGLRPLVVTVPGHAFVGWHTVAADKQPKQVFLETTLVGSASFEDALAVATLRVIEEQKKGNLDNGVVQILDVASLRKRGYTAQPYE